MIEFFDSQSRQSQPSSNLSSYTRSSWTHQGTNSKQHVLERRYELNTIAAVPLRPQLLLKERLRFRLVLQLHSDNVALLRRHNNRVTLAVGKKVLTQRPRSGL